MRNVSALIRLWLAYLHYYPHLKLKFVLLFNRPRCSKTEVFYWGLSIGYAPPHVHLLAVHRRPPDALDLPRRGLHNQRLLLPAVPVVVGRLAGQDGEQGHPDEAAVLHLDGLGVASTASNYWVVASLSSKCTNDVTTTAITMLYTLTMQPPFHPCM